MKTARGFGKVAFALVAVQVAGGLFGVLAAVYYGDEIDRFLSAHFVDIGDFLSENMQ